MMSMQICIPLVQNLFDPEVSKRAILGGLLAATALGSVRWLYTKGLFRTFPSISIAFALRPLHQFCRMVFLYFSSTKAFGLAMMTLKHVNNRVLIKL